MPKRPSRRPRPSRRRPELAPFGERVRSHRYELGLTQEGLAERAGLDSTYIGGIERGERNLGLINVLKVARGLDLDPGDLMRGL